MVSINRFFQTNDKFILMALLLFAIIIRLIGFGDVPPGLNTDEASIGYDAYALFYHGIDRNGFSYPVHFVSWGSGQNALYAYVLMPFLYLLEFNEFTVRFVNLLFGSISLFIFYDLIKKIINPKVALISLLMLAINPWHIMMSRWALESNLFPTIFLIAVYCLIKALKKPIFIIISAVFLAISFYSYGTAYLFIPIFYILMMFFLYKKNYFSLKVILKYSVVLFIFSIPIILFLIINIFDLETIRIWFISIPRLPADAQFMSQSSFFGENNLSEYYLNLKLFIIFIITQKDVIWNTIPEYGYMYMISLPFVFIGIYESIKTFKKSSDLNYVFLLWLSLSIVLAMTFKICTNRINIIFYPIIYFLSLGIYHFVKKCNTLILISKINVFTFLSLLTLLSFSKYQNEKMYPYFIFGFSIIFLMSYILEGIEFNVTYNENGFIQGLKNKNYDFCKNFLTSQCSHYLMLINNLFLVNLILRYGLYFPNDMDMRSLLIFIVLLSYPFILFIKNGIILKRVIKSKEYRFISGVFGIYLSLFVLFYSFYLSSYLGSVNQTFSYSVGDAIKYQLQNWNGKTYLTDKLNMPYIYILFYTKYNPTIFIKSVEYDSIDSPFRHAMKFRGYEIGNFKPDENQDCAYILHNSEIDLFSNLKYNVTKFSLFSVAIPKNDIGGHNEKDF